jgi:hypothetical protein
MLSPMVSETPKWGITQNKENIMAKAKKGVKTTVTGTIVDVSKLKFHNGQEVRNVDIILRGGAKKTYVDIAFWGRKAAALVEGKKLSANGKKWEVFQEALRKGLIIEVEGFMVMKDWTPTKSKKLPKKIKKPQIAVYSRHQLKIEQLLPL